MREDGTLEITGLPQAQPGVTVTINMGTERAIITVAQQLAWLTAALHYAPLANGKGPSLSNVSLTGTKAGEFIIEPEGLTDAEGTEESCWHEMVGQSLIANGFPIPPRASQIGLQLPYESMLKLGRITNCVTANNRMVIYGISSLLYPIKAYQGVTDQPREYSIQWHFEDNSHSHPDDSDEPNAAPTWNMLAYDEETLPSLTHFVGYYEKAGIHLGQADCAFKDIQRSGLEDASGKLHVRIKSITTGYSTYASVAIEFIYPKRTTMSVDIDWYEDVLRTTGDMSALLWDPDQDVMCGWLVPIQPVMFHMAHIWTLKEKPEEDFRHAPSAQTVGEKFLEEVADILKIDGGKKLRKDEGDKKFHLKDLIMRMYIDIRGCELARSKVESENGGSFGLQNFKSFLRGWELMDFIDRPFLEHVLVEGKIGGCGWEELVQVFQKMLWFWSRVA